MTAAAAAQAAREAGGDSNPVAQRQATGSVVKTLANAAQTQPVALPKSPRLPIHIVPLKDGQGAAAAGFFAPPGTHMIYFGGPVITNVHVVQVLYGPGGYLSNVSSTAPPSVASFFHDVTQSQYFDLLSEFSTTGLVAADGGAGSNQMIGHGFFDGQFSITPAAANNGAVITDDQIQAELLSQVTAGNLPAPQLDGQGNGNTIYMIYFPPGKTIRLGNISSCATQGFCAYHNSTTARFASQPLFYGVLPDMQPPSLCSSGCGSTNPFDNVTVVTSHELAEAVSDADVGNAIVVGRPLAWLDPISGAEIGDVCEGQNTVINMNGNTYVVQQEFSNLQNFCTAAPVTYHFDLPFSITPSTEFSLTVRASSCSNCVNALSNYRGTVHFTSSDPGAVLPADYTYTSADAGVHTFVVALKQTGSQTITAMDTVFPFTGSISFQVQPTLPFTLLANAPRTANAGVPITVVLTAVDNNFSFLASYNGTVHFSSDDPLAVLPADTALVNGTGSFQVTFNTQATNTVLRIADVAAPTLGRQVTFTVFAPGPNATTTTVTASPNPSTFGQPVTYIATVTNSATLPPGTVNFGDFVSAPVDATGHAQATLSLQGGTHIIFAEYSGINGNSSSGPLTAIVNPAPVTVSLTSSQATPTFGQSIVFVATVQPSVTLPATGNPGSITFSDGGNPIAVEQAGIGNGVNATFIDSSLSVGSHSVTASFSGTANFAPATSAPLIQQVAAAGAPDYLFTVNSSTATVSAGQAATFVFNMQSVNGFSGTIRFSCGSLPVLTSCTFSPTTDFVVTAGTAQTLLIVKTTGPHAALVRPGSPRGTYAALFLFVPFAVGLLLLPGARRSARSRTLVALLFSLLALAAITSCGGGGGGSVATPVPTPTPPTTTPAGTSTIVVTTTATPASGPRTASTKQLSISLTVL